MKLRLALCSVSLAVLSACASNEGALRALSAMQLAEPAGSPGFSYKTRTGSGDTVVLQDVTLGSAEDAAAGGAAVKVKSITLSGLGMTKDDKPVVSSIVMSGIAPASEEPGMPSVHFDSMGVEGLNPVSGQFLASVFTKAGPGEMPAFDQLGFKRISVNGLTVAGDIPQDEATAGKVNVHLGELSLNDLKNSTLGQFRFAGLKGDLNIPGQPAVAGAFDFGKLDISTMHLGMVAKLFEAGMKAEMSGEQPDYAGLFAGYTSPLESSYDRLNWSPMKVDISGIKFDTTVIDHTLTRNAAGVAIATHTAPFKLTLSADSQGGTLGGMGLMLLAMAGYPSQVIELYGQGDATFDPAKDITRWSNYNIGLTDLIDLKISGGLSGLEAALPTLMTALASGMSQVTAAAEEGGESPDEEKLQSAASGMAMTMVMSLINVQVLDLDVQLTDKALLDFILKMQTMESGGDPVQLRKDLSAMVAAAGTDMAGMGIDPALATEFTTALSGFLAGPGTLHISMHPKTPLGMMSVMMSPPTKESLGFSATFTPAAK